MNIYYYHNLNLTFKSAQTIQVVRDYYYLSQRGCKVFLYGLYQNIDDLKEIKNYLQKNSDIFLQCEQQSKLNKILIKFKIIKDILSAKPEKYIVIRHYKNFKIPSLLKKITKSKIVLEMHEESLPHLLKNKKNLKCKFFNTIKQIDILVFTNFSQKELFLKEFKKIPTKYIVLPNGVEIEKFQNAKKGNDYIITYIGQFNRWKNVELIFQSMQYLPKQYRLKIAGGKNNKESELFIEQMIKKYNLDGRVDFFGYIPNQKIPDFINGSSALLLPLGNNIQSKYLTSPMKLFEYMATQIPVVAVDYPSVNKIVHNEIYLAKNNPKDFAQKIEQAVENKNLDIIMKMNKLAIRFSYKNRAQKYYQFLKENL